MADACRPHGTLVLAGLGHAGGQGSSAYSQSVLWAPSRVADVVSREMPDGDGAGRRSTASWPGSPGPPGWPPTAGLDGVEIDAGPCSLLRQFHSGLTNLRADAYGTDRLRLTREVLAAVRQAVGPEPVLVAPAVLRRAGPLGRDHPRPGRRSRRRPGRAGGPAGRGARAGPSRRRPTGPTPTPPATFNVDLCRRMREAAGGRVPVVLQGSVVDPAAAEAALDDGTADLVEMTRAQIADARLVARVRGRRRRPGPALHPLQPGLPGPRQPQPHRELRGRAPQRPRDHRARPRRAPIRCQPATVLVVGGGPAGLECARVLAGRGHRVRLVERGRPAGRSAPRPPRSARAASGWPGWPTGWRPSAGASGWRWTSGTEVTPADLDAATSRGARGGPGHRVPPSAPSILRSTGPSPSSTPLSRSRPGARPAARRSGGGATTRSAGPSGSAWPSGWPARGAEVAIVTPDPSPAPCWPVTGDLADANTRLQRAGVRRRAAGASSGGARAGRALLEDVWTGERREIACSGHRRLRPSAARRVALPRRRPGDSPGRRLRGPPDRPRGGPGGPAAGPGDRRRRRGGIRVSAGGHYRHLFTPLRLGPVTVRQPHRVLRPPHQLRHQDGLPTEQHAAYYAARAAGGAGLIITEEHSTHPTDWPYEKLIHGFNPEVIPGYRRITEAVHAHDVPILAQINHNGGQASSMYTRLPVWAPSPVPDPLFREVPKAVEPTRSPRSSPATPWWPTTACAGGFDGIELQCSHSSIVRGFLSPATNRRTDGYGGSLANRARLLLEIVDAVRDAIGTDKALGVRLCGDELIEGGTDIDDAVAVARMVDASGQVDYINTSIGVATATLYMIEASMQVPPGYAMFIPSAIREAVGLPVVGVGRFKDPLQADRALDDGPVRPGRGGPGPDRRRRLRGQGPVRPRRRHPHLPVLQPGVRGPDGPQPLARLHREPPHRPGVDPAAPPRPPAREGGGGGRRPRRAAGGGHGRRAGPPGRPVRTPRPARRAGAGGRQRAQPGRVPRHHPQPHRPRPPRWASTSAPAPRPTADTDPGRATRRGDRGHRGPARRGPGGPATIPGWSTSATCSRAGSHPHGDVVVVDELGFHQATSTAELLADRGCRVEIVTNGMVVGQDLGHHPRPGDLERARPTPRASARASTWSPWASAAGDGGAHAGGVAHRCSTTPPARTRTAPCDWVVCAVHQQPEDDLWRSCATSAVPGPPGRRLPGPAPGPRRGHRGPPGGGGAVTGARASASGAVAVVVARDGRLPAGRRRGGGRSRRARSWWSAPGRRRRPARLLGAPTAAWWCETGAGPAAGARWPAALAPALAGPCRWWCCPPRPTAATWPRGWPPRSGRPLLAGAVAVDARPTGRRSTVRAEVSRLDDRVLVPVDVAGPAVATLVPGSRTVPADRPDVGDPRPSTAAWPSRPRRPGGAGPDPEVVDVLEPDPAHHGPGRRHAGCWPAGPGLAAGRRRRPGPGHASSCWRRWPRPWGPRPAPPGWPPTPAGPATSARSAPPAWPSTPTCTSPSGCPAPPSTSAGSAPPATWSASTPTRRAR